MNTEQIVRLALFQANAVKQTGSALPFASDGELYAWANDGNIEVEKILREQMDDYFLRMMNSSTDTTAEKIMGIDYTPSTSLRLAASTTRFTLPPDFETLRSMRCVTSSYEYMRFIPLDLSTREFQYQLRRASTDTFGPGIDLLYDITGERTLWIAPQLNSAIDIEIGYIARTKKLVRYTTGSIASTTATTAVTGTGTTWSTGTPMDSAYLDIMFAASANAALPVADPSWAYNGVNLARVSSITNDTALVLASNKVGTLASGTGYILASVPVVPPEFHMMIVDWVTWKYLAKAGATYAADADRYKVSYEKRTDGIRSPITRRQHADVERVEDWVPYDY